MDIAYAAHTSSCIFMLDDEGVCRWVVTRGAHVSRQTVENAQRCIGAQYVASLDVASPGGLLPSPRIGAQMLFAVVDADGRIALARSGAVTRFEDRRLRVDAGGRGATSTLPYDALSVGSGAHPVLRAGERQSLEIDVTFIDDEGDGDGDEPTHFFGRRERGSSTPPASRPRATRLPEGPTAVPPAFGDSQQRDTGRYLPIEARALRHLARLKK